MTRLAFALLLLLPLPARSQPPAAAPKPVAAVVETTLATSESPVRILSAITVSSVRAIKAKTAICRPA